MLNQIPLASATFSRVGEELPHHVKLVEAGRIVYRESFEEQAARTDRTWGRYQRMELSEKVREWKERFEAMRDREVAAARKRLAESEQPR